MKIMYVPVMSMITTIRMMGDNLNVCNLMMTKYKTKNGILKGDTKIILETWTVI